MTTQTTLPIELIKHIFDSGFEQTMSTQEWQDAVRSEEARQEENEDPRGYGIQVGLTAEELRLLQSRKVLCRELLRSRLSWLHVNRHFRQRLLEVCLSDVEVNDDHERDIIAVQRLTTFLTKTANLPRDIASRAFVRHLYYGPAYYGDCCSRNRDDASISQEDFDEDMDEIHLAMDSMSGHMRDTMMRRDENNQLLKRVERIKGGSKASWEPCTLVWEQEEAIHLLKALPAPLPSLTWRSPVPMNEEMCQILESKRVQDVFLAGSEYFHCESQLLKMERASGTPNSSLLTSSVPCDLRPWKHAARLRIHFTIEGYGHTASLSAEDATNLLADFLTSTTPHLECFETDWGPIFGIKRCLPRFACVRVGFEKAHFHRIVSGREFHDQPLYRNVRRLRTCLRAKAKSRLAASKSATLKVADIQRLCNQMPFEHDPTWSLWLEEESLVKAVADAFNLCPNAMEEDLAWHPARSCGGRNRVRDEWPSGAEPWDADRYENDTASESGTNQE